MTKCANCGKELSKWRVINECPDCEMFRKATGRRR